MGHDPPGVGSSRRWPSFSRFYDSRYIHTLEDSHRGSKGPSAQQCVWVDRPGSPGQQARRSTAVRTSKNVALRRCRRPPRWHHGGRRELLRAARLRPSAAKWQPSKAASKAASDSLLPHTGCSLRSGCAMDESHGVSTQSSTLCGRGRAGKLTWASQSVGKHGAAAPALVRARTLPSAARSATLLPARRLATPATP